jgi:hypothetical protein
LLQARLDARRLLRPADPALTWGQSVDRGLEIVAS